MKRKSILAALIVLLLAVVAWGVLRRTAIIVAAPGSGAIEQWCGSQLLAIANAHLGPELSFETLDYQYPATVLLGEAIQERSREDVVAHHQEERLLPAEIGLRRECRGAVTSAPVRVVDCLHRHARALRDFLQGRAVPIRFVPQDHQNAGRASGLRTEDGTLQQGQTEQQLQRLRWVVAIQAQA